MPRTNSKLSLREIKRQRPVLACALILFSLLPLAAPSRASAPATAPTTQPAPARPAISAAPKQNLLAHGTDKFLWVARITPSHQLTAAGEMTHIYYRAVGTDALLNFTEVPARVMSMACVGRQVAALYEGGDWWLLSDDGAAVSPDHLPDSATMLALADEEDVLWAIGAIPAALPTTQPMTAPATVMPPANRRLALYKFDFGGRSWQPADGAPLPQDLPVEAPLSLAIIDHVRYLAIRRENNKLQVWKQTPPPAQAPIPLAGSSWISLAISRWARAIVVGTSQWRKIAELPAPTAFKLLSRLSSPLSPATLWAAGENVDQLTVLQQSGPGLSVALETSHVPVSERTGVYSANLVWELAVVDGKLVEEDFNPRTQEHGSPRTIAFPADAAVSLYSYLFEAAIAVALLFAIVSSMRRRRQGQDAAAAAVDLAVADPGRRLAAGLIDAVPFAAPIALVSFAYGTGRQAEFELWDTLSWLGAFAVYLLHTSVSEALTRRTLGKMIVGLRVVRTDGATPDIAALLIRNFLRLVDVGLAAPLLFILFSPLRQRIGDVAAGTVVIRDRVRPEGNLVEPPEEEEPAASEAPSRPEPPPATDGE